MSCSKCNTFFCYLCGTPWSDKHECKEYTNIHQLEYGDYDENCCIGCGGALKYLCCSVLFSCQRFGIGCCLWNIFSIPIRLMLALFVGFFLSLYMMLAMSVFALWLCLCISGGFTYQFCHILFSVPFPIPLLLIIFYPLVGIYGTVVVAAETRECPIKIIGGICEGFCEIYYNIWVKLSPRNC